MKTKIEIPGGLISDNSTRPPTCLGYIFNFPGHGAYSPSGRVEIGGRELSTDEIAKHNQILAEAELAGIKKTGRGVLYITPADPESLAGKFGHYKVSTWNGTGNFHTYHERKSWHNMAGKDGRLDVWFMLDGSRWHGVNIGDNQLLRVRRCKS